LIKEVQAAERLGFGSAWLSERFDVKEAGVCMGAAAAVTESIYLGTAGTNINTRHIMASAAMASTANRLSEGRFALGIARGVGIRQDLWGLDGVKNQQLREFTELVRPLWRGERVMGHSGQMGNFPYLHASDFLDEDIPLMFVGFGAKSLAFAASCFDGVILHTFMSDEAVRRASHIVAEAAVKAGKEASAVKVWAVMAALVDPSREEYLRRIIARMATYLQAPGYAELLLAANAWDDKPLTEFREHSVVKNMLGGIDSVASLEQLEEISTLIPAHWLPAAVGSAEKAAQRLYDQLNAGADGVILHASTADELAPLLSAYEKIRDHERFKGYQNRPA
jgi:probable F420-dependent oxidoreductase